MGSSRSTASLSSAVVVGEVKLKVSLMMAPSNNLAWARDRLSWPISSSSTVALHPTALIQASRGPRVMRVPMRW